MKTLMRASVIKSLQGSLSRARALAQYELADGNAALINTELDAAMKVTAGQIQAAAKKYLRPDKRAVLQIVPAPKPQASPSEKKGVE